MDIKEAISFVTKAGAVIIATLTSFLVTPPLISPEENGGVNWKNIFVFVAGVLCILLYPWIKQKSSRISLGIWLISLFVLVVSTYEILYNNFSINCWDKVRCVISSSYVKDKEVSENLNGWIQRSEEPLKDLLQAYGCHSIKVWDMSVLAVPYYSMLVLYLIAILILTLLLLFLSELILKK